MSEVQNGRMSVSDLSNYIAGSKMVDGIRSTMRVAIHTIIPNKTKITL